MSTEQTFTVALSRSVWESTTVVVRAVDGQTAEQLALEQGRATPDWERDLENASLHVQWVDETPAAPTANVVALKEFWESSEAISSFHETSGTSGAKAIFDGRRIVIASADRSAFATISVIKGWYALHTGSDLLMALDPDGDLKIVSYTWDLDRTLNDALEAVGLETRPTPSV